MPDHTVPTGRIPTVDAFPGTSYQARQEQAIARRMATIMLSLWDEIHSPRGQRRDSTHPGAWKVQTPGKRWAKFSWPLGPKMRLWDARFDELDKVVEALQRNEKEYGRKKRE
jgi:hypothetical protein